jgi:phosphatidylethanolamine/phosphatidyl-N-methylethanolamine N-methyltransferase
MSKQSDKFYNRFSIFYPLIDVFLKPQKRKLFEEITMLPFGKLLEIGVGNGSHLQLYKTHEIVCIDTSSAMLEVARKYQSENMELLEMSGEALRFEDGTFDYVVLSHVIAVVDDPEKLLQETYRVLKPTGRVFILNHFTPSNGLRYVDHAFQSMAKIFHFRSVFRVHDLKTLKKFKMLKEVRFRPFSYFKLLIFCKA